MKLIWKLLAILPALLIGIYIGLFPEYVDYNRIEDSGIRLLSVTRSLNGSFVKENPYNMKKNEEILDRHGFCALKFKENSLDYYLRDFQSEEQALKEGWTITHKNKCGACSTLKDLAVYLNYRDLTRPVRKCTLMVYSKPLFMNCIQRLGFTEDCANIWYYNALNTFNNCIPECFSSWFKGEKLNKPDGSLNDCIYCDEIKSGPNFKRFAGRIRRNSGIHAEIDRNTEEMYEMEHVYLGIKLNV